MERPTLDGLIDIGDKIMEMIREAENRGWHHNDYGTVEYEHYSRMVKRLEQCNIQITFWRNVHDHPE